MTINFEKRNFCDQQLDRLGLGKRNQLQKQNKKKFTPNVGELGPIKTIFDWTNERQRPPKGFLAIEALKRKDQEVDNG